MLPPSRVILPCGNAAVVEPNGYTYRCNYCYEIVGSAEEPLECKQKREQAEPFKNDYWMNINDDETERR